MGNYLLTGAGFSKSFGALLCSELTAELFNNLIEDKELQEEILNYPNLDSFESILSNVEKEHPTKINNLRSILKNIFQNMHRDMKCYHDNNVQNSVTEFFWNFDCIFTLNQDSFWKKCGNQYPNKTFMHKRNSNDLQKHKNHGLNYIELHGAFDWEEVFIIGNNKEEEIIKKPQIKKFHKFFNNCLSDNKSKLVIIGYSFADIHINNIISSAINNNKLEIFIWDSSASKIIKGIKPSTTNNQMAAYNDYIEGVSYEEIKKSIKGYLAQEFNLIGKHKKHIINFLNS